MPVTMICPNLQCGATVVAPDAARGKVVRCAQCSQLLMVPIGAAGAAPPAESSNDKSAKKKK